MSTPEVVTARIAATVMVLLALLVQAGCAGKRDAATPQCVELVMILNKFTNTTPPAGRQVFSGTITRSGSTGSCCGDMNVVGQ